MLYFIRIVLERVVVLKKFLNFIFISIKFFFVLLVILYVSFVSVQRLSGNKSVLGYRIFTVATGSMIGVYDINDVIAVKDFDTNKLKVGDDIAYKGEKEGFKGLLITHRIVKIEKDNNGKRIFFTKGVNSTVMDPSIDSGQILGKVVGVVPIITQINHIMKNKICFWLLFLFPIILIILLEVFKTIKEIKKEKSMKNSNESNEIKISLDDNSTKEEIEIL